MLSANDEAEFMLKMMLSIIQ